MVCGWVDGSISLRSGWVGGWVGGWVILSLRTSFAVKNLDGEGVVIGPGGSPPANPRLVHAPAVPHAELVPDLFGWVGGKVGGWVERWVGGWVDSHRFW